MTTHPCILCRVIPATATSPEEFWPCAAHEEPATAICPHCSQPVEMYGEKTYTMWSNRDQQETHWHSHCREEMQAEFRRDALREGGE